MRQLVRVWTYEEGMEGGSKVATPITGQLWSVACVHKNNDFRDFLDYNEKDVLKTTK